MIIAVANQKGGVGKTTTVAYVASAMAARGCRVLAVDLDPQASLTFFLGHDETALDAQERGLHHAIRNGDLAGVILSGTFDLVPSGIALAKSETELLSEPNGSLLLKELIEPLHDSYDYILLDCPPSLGMLTVNALNAANGVLLPVKTQLLSLIGLTQILETIRKIRRRANPRLKIVGILPTMHHTRNAHDAEVLKEITTHYSELPIFEPIPETTRLARAAGFTVESGSPPLFHEAYTRVASRLIGDKNPKRPSGTVRQALMSRSPHGVGDLVDDVVEVRELDVNRIAPNPHQPRRQIDATALDQLAKSIETHGLLQPIIMRRTLNGYELIVGSRRLRAVERLGRARITAIVLHEGNSAILALIENLQRADLDPLDEAEALSTLKEHGGHTLEALRLLVGRSQSYLSEIMSLLKLPQAILSGGARPCCRRQAGAASQLGGVDTHQGQATAGCGVETDRRGRDTACGLCVRQGQDPLFRLLMPLPLRVGLLA